MYKELQLINQKPKAFEFYTSAQLWTDSHTSEMMLAYHLNDNLEAASRNSEFIKKSVEWIKSYFTINKNSNICDFGCAIGLYTTPLAQQGAQVTGIDFSSRSIQYAINVAAENNLNINYHCQDYLKFTSDKKFDLLTMIMCDYAALSPTQRKQLLHIFHNLLKKEGKILFDVYSMKGFEARKEESYYEHNQLSGFWSKNDYYTFVNIFKYPAEKVILDKYTIIEEEKNRVVYNWLQYFTPDSITDELKEAGFTVKEIFGNVSGMKYTEDRSEFAVVAEKTASQTLTQ